MGLSGIWRLIIAVSLLGSLFAAELHADILLSGYGWIDGKSVPGNFGPVHYDNAGNFIGGLGGGGEGGAGATTGSDGNFYYASINLLGGDHLQGQLERFDAHTGAYHYVAHSLLWEDPSGVAFDGMNNRVYVSSHKGGPSSSGVTGILAINGSTISQFISSGSGGLVNPGQLEIGPDQQLYVADNGTIRRYLVTGAYRGTIGPTAQTGAFAFGPDGYLYIARSTSAGGGIVKYDPSTGTFIDTFIQASLLPAGISDMTFGFDHNLYVIDGGDYSVDRYDGASGASMGTFLQPDQKKSIHPFRISFVDLPEPTCLWWLAGLSLMNARRKAKQGGASRPRLE